MKLELTNINKINHAEINLNGLTVIAGINDSGKSTIGKVLFSIIKGINAKRQESDLVRRSARLKIRNFYKYINMLEKEEHVMILGNILPEYPYEFMMALKSLEEPKETYCYQLIEDINTLSIKPQSKAILTKYANEILAAFFNRTNSLDYLQTELQTIIEAEFLNSICTYDTEYSNISFFENNLIEKLNITIKKNKISAIKTLKEENNILEDVTLIESPLYIHLIDILSRAETLNERMSAGRTLIRPLVNYHIKDMAKKLDAFRFSNRVPSLFGSPFQSRFDNITGGHFVLDEKNQNIYWSKNDKQYSVVNVASGIKSFGILQMLLEVQAINERKMLIWDEPENHLHPEWQIKMAEFLVELASSGIPILVSSHSPYFIQGIKYYSSKAKLEKYVNYYMADETSDGTCVISDYTHDLNKIFFKLAQPMNEIINMEL